LRAEFLSRKFFQLNPLCEGFTEADAVPLCLGAKSELSRLSGSGDPLDSRCGTLEQLSHGDARRRIRAPLAHAQETGPSSTLAESRASQT
jgi:hypothetical protein